MGDIYQDFYAGAQNCINTSFCLDGGSFDSTNISLPRSLKIRVIANPDYWGFGDTSGNTLIEGWGTFNNGHFDFFDGFEPDHAQGKDCNDDGDIIGPFSNEQRPDVTYRSVYDPENGHKHYASGEEDGILRGGAESYLLDRIPDQTVDNRSCDTTIPTTVFKTNPAGYGIAPKILFNSDIYKNITGAWRINECSGCYTQHDGGNELRNLDCSGAPKQHIQGDDKFATLYDPFRNRCVASGFAGESGCNSDGVIASEYAGSISGVFRDTGVSPFLQYHFQYDGGAASGIFNGKSIGITATSGDGGALTFFDVQHTGNSTRGYAVGSQGKSNYSNTDSGTWTLFDSYDPNTCCGGAAYGVDPALMNLTNSPLYHIDIGRVFNDPKNKIYSNRIDRTYNGLTVKPEVPKGTFGVDHKYVAVNESGHGLLVESGALYEVDLACQTEVWSATGDYIYKLDGQYSTESGIGAEALSTDSGFYPLFPKTLPYYGPFNEVDRFDYTERSNQYGNKQKNRNATCYTKQGSLSVYPDCLTQYTQYVSCDPKIKYDGNNVPRIALVYKGCDYNEPCTFDDSGRPWTAGASGHPSGMDDLIRGFGGQEIQMYINLGTARAAEIKREPCCCEKPCPGTLPPEYVEIPSPVTFPCFPKFDLRPEDYGCQDPLYYFGVMNKLGLSTDTSDGCSIPYYDACDPVQPYTTYGYIRNLCGKETNSRRGVIDSLASKLHTGDYNDLNPTDNTIEPMYVEFEQQKPDCCSPSGFSTGTTGCDPGLNFDSAGSGASGELVIDAAGGMTYNVTAAGSGYQFGGNVLKVPTSILSPEQTWNATFGAPDDGLLSFTSTPGNLVPATPSGVTIPLTIVAGGSGAAFDGGVTYTSCSGEDLVHYWGLTDYQGKLSTPYYRTESGFASTCKPGTNFYIDYSETGTILKGWPKSGVPFLVEIDHEEYCSSCSTTQMPCSDLMLNVSSLDTSYLHGLSSPHDSIYNDKHFIYGWTHNEFPGIKITPLYDPTTDTWEEDFCEDGDGLAYKYGQPKFSTPTALSETCACANLPSPVAMAARTLVGTNIPIGYSTNYFPLHRCGQGVDNFWDISSVPGSAGGDVLSKHQVYMNASISCGDIFGDPWSSDSLFATNGLDFIYGCNAECATSFPAPNSMPDLKLDFYYVSREYEDVFSRMSPENIHNNRDFLKNGLIFGAGVSQPEYQSGAPGSPGGLVLACADDTGVFTALDTTLPCEEPLLGPKEEYFSKVTCVNGNSGMMEADSNIDKCLGSRLVIYSCSWWKKGVYNRYHGNSDGKFGGGCDSAVWSLAGSPLKEQQRVDGCLQPGFYWPTGEDFDFDCFIDRQADYIPEVASALIAYSGGNIAPLVNLRYSCQPHDPARCCYNFEPDDTNPPDRFIGTGPFDPSLVRTPFGRDTDFKGCECRGAPPENDYMDVAYDVTYKELTHPITGNKTIGWYGTANFPTVANGNCDNQLNLHYWSGENLPGLGNIGPLPLYTPIAFHYQDDGVPTDVDLGAFTEVQVEPFCAYHTGPNATVQVGAELFEPYRPTTIADGESPNLQPETCTNTNPNNFYRGNCGVPFPFDTYIGGKGSYGSNEIASWYNGGSPPVTVTRKSGWPEIQTVTKVECLPDGYRLHVTREYFEHDRHWYHIGPDCNGNPVTFKRLGLIDGGEEANSYENTGCIEYDPDTGDCIKIACDPMFEVSCADPSGAAGETPNASSPNYFVLPVMTPTDSVHPKYPAAPDSWHTHLHYPCATGESVFDKTNTSFDTTNTTLSEHPSGCPYFPAISGESFWGYYNLIYDKNDPDSKYVSGSGVYAIRKPQCEDCPSDHPFNLVNTTVRDERITPTSPFTKMGATFIAGSQFNKLLPGTAEFNMLNHNHSCLQELDECGGMFWNNKEFFPRKSTFAGTRVTAFGALSICEQNAQLEGPVWYDGHTGKTKQGPGTWDQSPNKTELIGGRFIDACDSSAAVASLGQHASSDLLHIPFLNEDGTKNSLLTLMGVIHPGFKSNLNEKTCLYPEAGCLDFLAEHTDSTIRDTVFTPDEYGYYLDHLVASGSHGCLFSPFKIMVDVECCPDRVGHKGTSSPTNLNYMAKVPAPVCEGWVKDPSCLCGPVNSCTNRDVGPLLPELTCSTANIVMLMVSGEECYTECVSLTGEIPGLTKERIWAFTTASASYPHLPDTPYLFDPQGGNPLDAATFIGAGFLPVTDLESLNSGCPDQCEVVPDGSGPPVVYDWMNTSSMLVNLYQFQGVYFHVPLGDTPEYMDIFEFNGIKYRFANNDPISDDNCCDGPPDGDVGIGISPPDGDGCDCEWNQCNNMLYAIPIGNNVAWTGFPDPAYTTLGVEEGPGPPGGIVEIFDQHGCTDISSIRGGFYPSAVQITITE